MPKDASRRELSKSGSRIEKGALCAELRPFYCSIRISVPMSYLFLVILENMAKKLYMAHVDMVNKTSKWFKKVTWYILQGDK